MQPLPFRVKEKRQKECLPQQLGPKWHALRQSMPRLGGFNSFTQTTFISASQLSLEGLTTQLLAFFRLSARKEALKGQSIVSVGPQEFKV